MLLVLWNTSMKRSAPMKIKLNALEWLVFKGESQTFSGGSKLRILRWRCCAQSLMWHEFNPGIGSSTCHMHSQLKKGSHAYTNPSLGSLNWKIRKIAHF